MILKSESRPVTMSRQQSIFVYAFPGPPTPKASRLDYDASSCAPATSSSDQTEPEEQETVGRTETACIPNKRAGAHFPRRNSVRYRQSIEHLKSCGLIIKTGRSGFTGKRKRRGCIALFAEMCMCWASLRCLKTRSLPLSQLASISGKMH